MAEIETQGGKALALQADVADEAQVMAMFGALDAGLGTLSALVNNAGISARAPFDDPQTPQIWERVMNVNLQGTFNVTHAFVEQLKASRGAIVNLCSIVAYGCGISTAGYVVSK
ncbi:SDR family NAD(P)-dependent oxidoreductase, partial [Escherichia coli]|uniref:SDR family NAD(P)-dependent oxidoreductase n=1 Tax=Escherichia coli TaxID=562 RepID=UPI003F772154